MGHKFEVEEVMPEVDLPRLRKAVEWAVAESKLPEKDSQWYQADYYARGEYLGRTCDSAYCIAGWVVHEEIPFKTMVSMGLGAVDDMAREMLGITLDESIELFQGGNGIEQVVEVAQKIAERAGEKL